MKVTLAGVMFALGIVAAGLASVQQYPTKPVPAIVPSAPGGGAESIGRFIAQKLSERLGEQLIVANRPGAGGVLIPATSTAAQFRLAKHLSARIA